MLVPRGIGEPAHPLPELLDLDVESAQDVPRALIHKQRPNGCAAPTPRWARNDDEPPRGSDGTAHGRVGVGSESQRLEPEPHPVAGVESYDDLGTRARLCAGHPHVVREPGARGSKGSCLG